MFFFNKYFNFLFISACPPGRYGNNCSETCLCQNDGICDPVSGSCQCGLGWTGDMCDAPCPDGKFGPNCIHKCICQNGASCDKISGCCQCPEGWYGQQCEHCK